MVAAAAAMESLDPGGDCDGLIDPLTKLYEQAHPLMEKKRVNFERS